MARTIPRTIFAASALLALLGAPGCVSPFTRALPERLPVHADHVAADGTAGPLRAGAAASPITPEGSVYLAGFRIDRRSTGVRDDLWCRALVLERGGLRVALVAFDLIGLQGGDVRRIRERVAAHVPASNVTVHATHDHHAPDTLGLWGLPPFVSGRDEDYIERLAEVAGQTVGRAVAALREAEAASFAAPIAPEGIVKNLRRPGLVDDEVSVLHVRARGGGATIATLVSFGSHPEALHRRQTLVSSDYPGHVRAAVEAELGGTAIFVSGALGGMATPDVAPEAKASRRVADAECRRIGEAIGRHAAGLVTGRVAATARSPYEAAPLLARLRATIAMRIRNMGLKVARWLGLIERELYEDDVILTEVDQLRVGGAVLLSAPGEVVPDLGMAIKERARADGLGKVAFFVGLANDELGYILTEEDYPLELFDYERGFCPSPAAGTILADTHRWLGRRALQLERSGASGQ